MVGNKTINKIGEVNFEKFKTEFFIMPKLKKYLKDKGISLACLLPNGWLWYEVSLFDIIDKDKDGEPDKEFGANFKVIYTGVVKKRNLNNKKLIKEGFNELPLNIKEIIFEGETSLNNQDFPIKYIVTKR